MSLVICVAYFLLVIIIRKGIKDEISKKLIFVYVTYWCACLFLSSIYSNDYYAVRDTSYCLLLGHLFSFIFGFTFFQPSSKTPNFASKADLKISRITNNFIFLSLFVICFAFVFNLFMKQREMLLLYSLSDVRGDFVEMVLEGSGVLFYSTIATAMFHFCLCLSFYMLFFDRRWILIVPLLSYSFLFALLGGGRHQFAIFIYYALGLLILKNYIASSIRREKIKYLISRKMKFLLVVAFVFAVFIMAAFTALRSGESEYNGDSMEKGMTGLANTVINYSTGPIVAFEYGLNRRDFRREMYYGSATFSGTDRLLNVLIYRYLNPDYVSSYDKVAQEIQQNRIEIGPQATWNYAYTSCFLYYCDLGVLGIFLIPFVLGIIVRLLFNMIENYLTIYGIALFLFISFVFYDSVFSCYLHKQVSVLYIIILIIMSKLSYILYSKRKFVSGQ